MCTRKETTDKGEMEDMGMRGNNCVGTRLESRMEDRSLSGFRLTQ